MRIPFLQVKSDFITTDSLIVSALAGISQASAIGFGSLLFAFAVTATSSDEKPPDGIFLDPDAPIIIESAVGWTGDRGKLIDAFARAGCIEKLEVGLRVRGMEPYRAVWEKNKRDRERYDAKAQRSAAIPRVSAANPRESAAEKRDSAAETSLNRRVSPRQTQTQTQTQKEEKKKEAPREEQTAPGALRDSMDAEFLRHRGTSYHWTFPEERALQTVLGYGEEEVLRRWANALARKSFPKCSSVAELVKRWNDYATAEDGADTGPKPAAGPREPCDWAGCSRPSDAAVWGRAVCFGHVDAAQHEAERRREAKAS